MVQLTTDPVPRHRRATLRSVSVHTHEAAVLGVDHNKNSIIVYGRVANMESAADWPPTITRVPRKPKVAQFCATPWHIFTPPLRP